MPLTDREQAILEFERDWWTGEGPKDVLITETLAMSPSRYYQLLNGLLDRPDALAHDPLVVRRLRRLRERHRQTRLDSASARAAAAAVAPTEPGPGER